MNIGDYPKPHADTGLGFCYFPDEEHYRPADLERWLPELRALGASWLVLRSARVAPVPEAFVRGLLAAHVEPVVHLYGPDIARIDAADLRRTAERYAAWGGHYFCLYDQPNLHANWGADWGRPQLIERFVDLLLPALQTVQAAGLYPVLPPLAPGGQYWDLAFLASLLESLKRRAQASLFERLAVGMHNFAGSRPLTWGAGGPARWPQAQPYHTPAGSEDHRGFRLFEWYDAIVRARLGAGLPLISLGDGARLGLRPSPDTPPVDRAQHAQCHTAIAELFASKGLPPYVFNSAFWVLATAPGDPAAAQAWYDAHGRPRTPAVQALKARRSNPGAEVRSLESIAADALQGHVLSKGCGVRSAECGSATFIAQEVAVTQVSGGSPAANGRVPKSGDSPAPVCELRTTGDGRRPTDGGLPVKVLRHYVLLPVFEWGPSDWHWQAAQNYVQALRASCGFSPDEARLAERVTIIGNAQGVSVEVEAGLRAAGCRVARVAGSSGTETIALLNDLAQTTDA